MIRRIQSLLMAAFVVGGLTFGTAQLRAGGGGDWCTEHGYHGPCDAEGDCYELCIFLFPLNDGVGICFESVWCCMCAEK
jgi:hypothetical protein